MKINGKWYFNEKATSSSVTLMQDITFVSNGEDYVKIDAVDYVNGTALVSYTYLLDDGDNIFIPMQDYATNLVTLEFDEAYRTIDFGAAYQEVSDDFYNWLTANAVQLSKPIPMEHPKGIRLLTKGKKCTEDIEVVPTFMGSKAANVTIYEDSEVMGHYNIYYTNSKGVVVSEYWAPNSSDIGFRRIIEDAMLGSLLLIVTEDAAYQGDNNLLGETMSGGGVYNLFEVTEGAVFEF